MQLYNKQMQQLLVITREIGHVVHLVTSVCMCVCLSVCPVNALTFGMQVHHHDTVCPGHWVKVKVTEAKNGIWEHN